MFRKLMLGAAILALTAFSTPATMSAPQGKGGGGGGRGGGNPGGYHGGFHGNPGFNPGHGYHPGYYSGYRGYYPGYYGPGYGYGYGYPWGGIAFGYGLGRISGYGGYGVGSYSSPYYYIPSGTSTSLYGSAPTYSQPPPSPDAASTQARITVVLPADARLWIGEYVSTLTGPSRLLLTPPLDPSMNYSYTLLAKWTENGQEVSRTREVKFLAGETMTVDMTASEPIPALPKPTTPPVSPTIK